MSEARQPQGATAKALPGPLWIRELVRLPEQGPEDRLSLEPGVNVLVGVPNTGKSKWLRMVDYLFGDDAKAEDVFGDDLALKYNSVRAAVMVGEDEWQLERSWKMADHITKIRVNDDWMTLHDFTLKLMGALAIPVVHYPQGNPHGPRTWPELGWRSLYRHMYRRQNYWTDVADRQPESEQHACILQFVGIAAVLFSEQYGQKVSLEKRIQQLQSQRQQFVAMLQEVSRELVDESELGVALTPDSIAVAIKRHEAEVAATQERRQAKLRALLEDLAKPKHVESSQLPKDVLDELGQQLAQLRADREAGAFDQSRTDSRLEEIRGHRALIADELERMERATEAGSMLSELKVTHCPACDRPVAPADHQKDSCHLCGRLFRGLVDTAAPKRRLDFEVGQLREELKETDRLLDALADSSRTLMVEQARRREEIARIESRLKPVRTAAAAMLPPELALWDQDTGRLQERIAQLRRIRTTLEKRETLATEIERIQADVARLEKDLGEHVRLVSFEHAEDLLSDGMNTYLNLVKELKPQAWTQSQVDVVLRERAFAIRVGSRNWRSKLGGTLTLFFLIAYHYALMTLTNKPGCHYPGICILDFPPQLDGVAVSGSESFALEPFARMFASGAHTGQVIAAGSSFADLGGGRRVELQKVWA